MSKPRRTPRWIRRLSKRIFANPLAVGALAHLAVWYLKFVFKTNSWVVEPDNALDRIKPELPVIAAVWHGQHILLPAIPFGLSAAVMISRSFDGAVMAKIAELCGSKPIRASGGRKGANAIAKGGLWGLFEMVSALEQGQNVMQTADIPKGTPRKISMGIITLARQAGRPIVPIAVASSKRIVLPKSWDRTTINLPFGKSALVCGKPFHIGKNAGRKKLETARDQLEAELVNITKRAYQLTGKPE